MPVGEAEDWLNSVGQPSDYVRPAAGPHPEGSRRTKINDWRNFRPREAIHLGVGFLANWQIRSEHKGPRLHWGRRIATIQRC
jgi:hypothetical protein